MSDDGSEPPRDPEPPPAPFDRDRLRCSFCGKAYADVERIVCGPSPTVAICNECVEVCTGILAEERDEPAQH